MALPLLEACNLSSCQLEWFSPDLLQHVMRVVPSLLKKKLKVGTEYISFWQELWLPAWVFCIILVEARARLYVPMDTHVCTHTALFCNTSQ